MIPAEFTPGAKIFRNRFREAAFVPPDGPEFSRTYYSSGREKIYVYVTDRLSRWVLRWPIDDCSLTPDWNGES